MDNFNGMTSSEFKQALANQDPALINDMVRYLEDDPFAFRTGYRKQYFWRYIRRLDLTPQQVSRLETVAIKYLHRRPDTVFRQMCVTMAQIGTDGFWARVQQKIQSPSKVIRISAASLFLYSENIESGHESRVQTGHLYWRHSREFEVHDQMRHERDLLLLIKQPELWHGESVKRREIDTEDLPIALRRNEHRDHEYASLDMGQCYRDKMLNLLKAILTSANLVAFTDIAWIYALYILRQIDDERAVHIVANFLERYHFLGLSAEHEDLVMLASSQVLRHYGTSLATDTLSKFDLHNLSLHNNYQSTGSGWQYNYKDGK